MAEIFNPGIIQLTSNNGSVTFVPADGIGTIVDLAATGGGGSGITFTDGTHTIASATQLTVTGGTIGGTSPNATLTITGGSGSIPQANFSILG